MPGKGERGINGGENGDLYVNIRVRAHKHFVRQGDDISITIPVSAVDAALGCEVDVPTVYGDVSMDIPQGTQPGTTLRLKGKGVKNMRNPNNVGNQFVKVDVQIPKHLTKKERDLYMQLKALGEKSSIFDQFKKNFKF